MDKHQCKYEKEMAVLHENVETIKENTKQILKTLNGNGATGLITKVALNRQSISRMWWWVGGLSLVAIGVVIRDVL